MKISTSITGERELIAKLNKLSDKMGGQTLENAVVAGALLVQNAAKKNIVKKKIYLTGNLMRSIHIGGHTEKSDIGTAFEEVKTKTGKSFKTKRYKGTIGTDIGGNKNSRNSAEVLVGTNVVYAPPHEFGRGNLAARPYLRPALDDNKEPVAKEIGEALKDLLRAI